VAVKQFMAEKAQGEEPRPRGTGWAWASSRFPLQLSAWYGFNCVPVVLQDLGCEGFSWAGKQRTPGL